MELNRPGAISRTILVPSEVPSVRQSSEPVSLSDGTKKTWSAEDTNPLLPEESCPGRTSRIMCVSPPALASHGSNPWAPSSALNTTLLRELLANTNPPGNDPALSPGCGGATRGAVPWMVPSVAQKVNP